MVQFQWSDASSSRVDFWGHGSFKDPTRGLGAGFILLHW